MDIIEMARAAGLTVLLDGKIGREEYHSVSGSLPALRRFGEAFRAAADAEASESDELDAAVKD
ncbi:MAG TPA: hypothetical protein VF534_04340 [Paraburkholderia sp.]